LFIQQKSPVQHHSTTISKANTHITLHMSVYSWCPYSDQLTQTWSGTVVLLLLETDTQSSMFTVDHERFKITRFILTDYCGAWTNYTSVSSRL